MCSNGSIFYLKIDVRETVINRLLFIENKGLAGKEDLVESSIVGLIAQ